jgi:hypothetical protein
MKNVAYCFLFVMAIASAACKKGSNATDDPAPTPLVDLTQLVGRWAIKKVEIRVYPRTGSTMLKDSVFKISNTKPPYYLLYSTTGMAYQLSAPYAVPGTTRLVTDTLTASAYTVSGSTITLTDINSGAIQNITIQTLNAITMQNLTIFNATPDYGWGLDLNTTYRYNNYETYSKLNN